MSQGVEITNANVVLGFRCKSRCSHCFVSAVPDHASGMTVEIARRVASEIAESTTIREVHFSGGEPFSYADALSSAIEILAPTEKKIIISTGCSEFHSPDTVARLFSSLRRVDRLWVSFDDFHLENVSIENFRNLDRYVREHNTRVGFSICYKSIQHYARVLLRIKSEGFSYDTIVKQPLLAYGRGNSLQDSVDIQSRDIPIEFRCAEVPLANFWPDGTITNCGSFAGRMPNILRVRGLEEFIKKNSEDPFSLLRSKYCWKDLARFLEMDQSVNIAAPCAVCKSLLENGLLENIAKRGSDVSIS